MSYRTPGEIRPMRHLRRILVIMRKLQAGPVCIADLAREMKATERSIQRDLSDLWAAGFEVKRTARGMYEMAEGRL